MAKRISKVVKLAEKLAAKAEKRMRTELGALAKSGIISRGEAKQILKAAAREAAREEKRIRAFIISELKRELKKAKPAIKKTLARKKKQFESYRKRRK
jgi:hypothetical protein